MRYFWKLLGLIFRISERILILVKFKELNGKEILVGQNISITSTTRIKSWLKKGRILLGNNVSIGRNTELYIYNGEIEIGDDTSINDNCKIFENVKIGCGCLLASNIFISSGTHSFRNLPTLPIKLQDKKFAEDIPILIEDDCWLGFGVVVMPGVYIGKGAIIGSNSVVTKNITPFTINAGIPAREIGKRIDFFDSTEEIFANDISHWPYFYRGFDFSDQRELALDKGGLAMKGSNSICLLRKRSISKFVIRGVFEIETFLTIQLDGIFTYTLKILPTEFEKIIDLDQFVKEKNDLSLPHSLFSSFTVISLLKKTSVDNMPCIIRSLGVY